MPDSMDFPIVKKMLASIQSLKAYSDEVLLHRASTRAAAPRHHILRFNCAMRVVIQFPP